MSFTLSKIDRKLVSGDKNKRDKKSYNHFLNGLKETWLEHDYWEFLDGVLSGI